MIKKIFLTSAAIFKKVICTLAAILICLGCVSAITPEELHEQIRYAIVLVRQAEQRLRLKNPELTNSFIKERTNDEGHEAEIMLRRLYPKEYMEYLEAHSNLDSLLYTQYLMFANGKAE